MKEINLNHERNKFKSWNNINLNQFKSFIIKKWKKSWKKEI